MRVLNGKSIAALAATIGVVTALAVTAAGGAQAEDEPVRSGPPAMADPAAPSMARELGIGERLLLVVAGTFATRDEAVAHLNDFSFGELQGFYVAAVSQFAGLREALGDTTDTWALVSSFRTQAGALEFFDLAVAAGAQPMITPRVQSLPGDFTGLGQESEPLGDGPLLHAVSASLPEGAS